MCEVSLFGEVGLGGLIYVSATSFPRTLIFPPEKPWERAHAENVFVRGEHGLLLIKGTLIIKQTATEPATRTSPNKRFNEQNNGCARAL